MSEYFENISNQIEVFGKDFINFVDNKPDIYIETNWLQIIFQKLHIIYLDKKDRIIMNTDSKQIYDLIIKDYYEPKHYIWNTSAFDLSKILRKHIQIICIFHELIKNNDRSKD